MLKWRFVILALLPATPAMADEKGHETHPDGELPNPLAIVHFERGSTKLGADDQQALVAVVDWLEAHPRRLLILEGHTDSSGSRAANLRLSQRRVDAVKQQLVSLGAGPLRIVGTAHGESEATFDDGASRRVVVRGTLRPYAGRIPEQR